MKSVKAIISINQQDPSLCTIRIGDEFFDMEVADFLAPMSADEKIGLAHKNFAAAYQITGATSPGQKELKRIINNDLGGLDTGGDSSARFHEVKLIDQGTQTFGVTFQGGGLTVTFDDNHQTLTDLQLSRGDVIRNMRVALVKAGYAALTPAAINMLNSRHYQMSEQ